MLTVATIWADSALDREAVWKVIARRGREVARARAAPVLGSGHAPGMGCGVCGLVSAGLPCCPRCDQALHRRKPDSTSRTWALVIAAAILYVPANVYPVLTVVQLGAGRPARFWAGWRSCYTRACTRWPPWCSSPALRCRCRS